MNVLNKYILFYVNEGEWTFCMASCALYKGKNPDVVIIRAARLAVRAFHKQVLSLLSRTIGHPVWAHRLPGEVSLLNRKNMTS